RHYPLAFYPVDTIVTAQSLEWKAGLLILAIEKRWLTQWVVMVSANIYELVNRRVYGVLWWAVSRVTLDSFADSGVASGRFAEAETAAGHVWSPPEHSA